MLRTIALVLGLSASVHAQNALAPVAFRDFSGGYVDNVDSINLDPKASPKLLNVIVDEPVGSLKPRRGMVLCGNPPSGGTPTAIYEYSKSDGTRRLIVSDNGNIYSTPDCQAWTTVKTGLSSSAQTYFSTVRDKLWIVNGSTWVMTWNGSDNPIPSDPSDFNPTSTYAYGNWVGVGYYSTLDFGGGKKLYITLPEGTAIPGTVTNGSRSYNYSADSLVVELGTGNTLWVSVANATSSKNSAALIQAALRAITGGAFASATVTENAAYAAARPTAGTGDLYPWNTPGASKYAALAAVTGDANNTSLFPPIETASWGTGIYSGTGLTMLDGNANTPNPTVPKCSFIEFWKERVWCGAPSGDLSGVAFSALTDSSGNDLDPSTGTLSWPASNNFQIDQNAGSVLNGIKSYRNRLYAFKSNGAWEIGFDNDFSNFVRKTAASIGSRYQTSITEVDGLLYFTGKDGIYAFDGEQTVRVSAKIENKFRDLNQPLISQNYKTWTTQTDFEGGTFSSATASVISGSVVISTKPSGLSNGSFESGSISPWICTTPVAAASEGFCGVPTHAQYTLEGVYSSSVGYYSGNGMTLYVFKVDGTTVTTDATWTANATSTKTIETAAYQGQAVYLHFHGTTADGGSVHLYSSSFTVLGNITFQYFFNGTAAFYGLDNFQTNQYYSSATWTSDIYNAVAVSTWGAFEANGDENGGALTYQIRYGTNTGAVQAMTFAAITPGSLIPANTSHIYIQARVILSTTAASTNTPQLDDIQIAWNSGGSNTQKIYAAGWKNALWVSASSGTATSNNMVMTKTKLPLDAWTLSDHQIGPMATFSDSFYAGASTHSAIYRMDYGTNDDGRAITWYWESKDEVWNMPYNYKQVREMTADFKKGTNASSVKLGYSIDNGVTWSDRTINMSGTGYGTTRQFVNGGLGYSYRFRIFNNTIDQAATITGVTGWARANQRRGD